MASIDGPQSTGGAPELVGLTSGPESIRPWRDRWRRFEEALSTWWPHIDGRLFVLWTSLATAWTASMFVGAMLDQTGGEWSAPLDDVFIHFDYARSTARGYPFQWSEGNGYSSGNTSMTYPFVLAFGYWVGFRGQELMGWSVIVACASMIAFFAGAARFVAPAGGWAKYLLAPVVLSLGALDWSLFSGMENAFHLGVWGVAAMAYDRFARLRAARPANGAAWWLGVALAVLVLTRPESVVCVAAFAFAASLAARPRFLHPLVAASAPSVVALAGQAVANRVFTGEWSQAGALAKLAIHHPYMTREDMWNDWVVHFKYVLARTTEHHFADAKPYGYILPAVALVPLAARALRGRAALLWAQVAGWSVIVATNGQVRWQNERYVMSGVAWLLVLVAMGLAALAKGFGETPRGRGFWGARLAVAGIAASLYWHHQLPNFRDQVWFFARASRNIRDQQVVAGRLLRELKPRRVLVGDAGAIVYASDLPGLDLIGLGGYRDYPFARATRAGLGASLELIERMPDADRPDVMAIYPSWWGDLPTVFGSYLDEVPVFGNVICGGAAKVVYKADWSPLDRPGLPRTLREGERVVGAVDVADLVDERAARYERPPRAGFVTWRVLPGPGDARRDIFDGGRIIGPNAEESFDVALPTRGGRLVVRTVSTAAGKVTVAIDGAALGEIELRASASWDEPSIDLPPGLRERGRVTLGADGSGWTSFHVWTTEGG